ITFPSRSPWPMTVLVQRHGQKVRSSSVHARRMTRNGGINHSSREKTQRTQKYAGYLCLLRFFAASPCCFSSKCGIAVRWRKPGGLPITFSGQCRHNSSGHGSVQWVLSEVLGFARIQVPDVLSHFG